MLLALCAGSNAVSAESLLDQVQQRGVLRIGTPGDYAPYSLTDSAEHRLGADIALAREMAIGMGLRAEFVPTTWATLLDDARGGKFDIALGGISITAERAAVVAFSLPYLKDSKSPVVRCGDERRYDTRGEINSPGVRLIVNRGGTNESLARRLFPRAMLAVHADNRTVFDEIAASRADVMVTDGIEARLQQARGQGLCAVNAGHWMPAGKAILVRKDAALREAIDSSLRAAGGSRAHARRIAHWIDAAALSSPPAVARMATLIDERLALVTEVARYKWNTGTAIEDAPREQALLASLRERAPQLGLDPARVDAFFLAQIEAAKQLQRELFARWKAAGTGRFNGIADLATAIRPGIDQITNQMLQTLVQLPAAQPVVLPAASTVTGISPGAVRTARAPLQAPGT